MARRTLCRQLVARAPPLAARIAAMHPTPEGGTQPSKHICCLSLTISSIYPCSQKPCEIVFLDCWAMYTQCFRSTTAVLAFIVLWLAIIL